MDPVTSTLITTTIGNFCQISGIGRSTTYELLASGELASVKIGRRRLVVLDSYRQMVEQRRQDVKERIADRACASTSEADQRAAQATNASKERPLANEKAVGIEANAASPPPPPPCWVKPPRSKFPRENALAKIRNFLPALGW